jgi:hypothetical protein
VVKCREPNAPKEEPPVPGFELPRLIVVNRPEALGFSEVCAVGFSPDGLRCAATGPGKVVVWDVDV